ncbi:hypothetical protein NL478_27820, partial [Klebsiella pneumoniae]|nr:hypothetical protein [Klebsiella pneumoniae]
LNLALKYTLKVGNSSLAEKITKIIENECDADDKLSELEIPYSKLSNNPSTSYNMNTNYVSQKSQDLFSEKYSQNNSNS